MESRREGALDGTDQMKCVADGEYLMAGRWTHGDAFLRALLSMEVDGIALQDDFIDLESRYCRNGLLATSCVPETTGASERELPPTGSVLRCQEPMTPLRPA
jgi:hypothetical protein